MEKQWLTIYEIAILMKDGGDPRNLEALRSAIHRARRKGRFPGAIKVGQGRTSTWMIPTEEAKSFMAR